ncbi:MAG: lysophospholipid acyltransferase family protein [Bacteroidota bacterium]
MRKEPEPVRRWTWPHYYTTSWLSGLFMKIMGGFKVRGRDHLPRKGGALICANHVSYLDPPALGAGVLPRRTYYFAKKELFRNPLFGYFLTKHYAFPVDRGAVDREAIRHAIDVLKQGEFLVLFPEGGRSPDGTLQPGNIGPALIASKAGVPIIPAALKETDKILPLHGGVHRGHVQLDFGEPIDISAYGSDRLTKEQMQEITEKLMSAIYELQKIQYERVGQTAPPRVKEKADAE